jgi:4-hydroxy-tetrahydrodipicolinate synthase
MLKLEGIIPPIPTPFNIDGSLNEELLKDLIKWYLSVGVNGIAVCGSTGEGYALLPDEYSRVCDVAVRTVGGKVLVVAGVIVNSLNQALTYGRLAKDAGVNVLMITPSHYIFTPSEEGLYRYFKTVAEVLNIPITIYNVIPQAPVPLNVIVRLVNDVKLLVGIKQSRGDISGLADIIRAVGDRISVMSAIDDLLYPSFVLGARGAIAAICTVAPELCVELYELVREGRYVEALKIHNKLLPIWRVVGQHDMPARVKTALELRGIPAGYPRIPLLPVGSGVRDEIKEVLRSVGLVG